VSFTLKFSFLEMAFLSNYYQSWFGREVFFYCT
jgi:hypothetical protein